MISKSSDPSNHDHSHHGHSHRDFERGERALLFVLVLTVSFMFCEYIGGYLANSLSLMSDAFHMLTDAAAIALSWLSIRLSKRKPTQKHTFGFQRLEVLGALLNGLFLLGVSGFIVWEAFQRFANPPLVNVKTMLLIGFLGLLVNLFAGYKLFASSKENLAIKGALLHVMGDAFGSVGVVVAALLISWKGWVVADPIVSVLVALLIVSSTIGFIREAIHLILEGAPRHIDFELVQNRLMQLSGVAGIHDLHIWSVRSGYTILTAHLVESETRNPRLLEEARKVLETEFGVQHTTLQIESVDLRDGCH